MDKSLEEVVISNLGPAIQHTKLMIKSVDHANRGFLNNQHFRKKVNTLLIEKNNHRLEPQNCGFL